MIKIIIISFRKIVEKLLENLTIIVEFFAKAKEEFFNEGIRAL